MIKAIFQLFLLYLLYKLVFDFIIPVYQTTKHVKKKMNEMQEKLQEQQKEYNNRTASTSQEKKSFDDEYIDYEEVK
jgi:sortase (surface protein transpeptidase)